MKLLFSIFIVLVVTYSAFSQTKEQIEGINKDCGSELTCIFKGCGKIFENIKDIDRCYYEILDTQKASRKASVQEINSISVLCNMESSCITDKCAKFADGNECIDKVVNVGKQKEVKLKTKKVETTEKKEETARSKWSIQRSSSAMDDSKTVSLILDANNYIDAYYNKSERPSLIIRCRENKTEVYIRTNVSANPELGLYSEFTVRIRMDEGKPFKQRWSESTDGEALFAPRSIALARKLSKSKKMLFEFTPYKSNSQLVEFNVRGLVPYLTELADTCNWNL